MTKDQKLTRKLMSKKKHGTRMVAMPAAVTHPVRRYAGQGELLTETPLNNEPGVYQQIVETDSGGCVFSEADVPIGFGLNSETTPCHQIFWAHPSQGDDRGNLESVVRSTLTMVNEGPFNITVRCQIPLGHIDDDARCYAWRSVHVGGGGEVLVVLKPGEYRECDVTPVKSGEMVPKCDVVNDALSFHLASVSFTRDEMTAAGAVPTANYLAKQEALMISVTTKYKTSLAPGSKFSSGTRGVYVVIRKLSNSLSMDTVAMSPPAAVHVSSLVCSEGSVVGIANVGVSTMKDGDAEPNAQTQSFVLASAGTEVKGMVNPLGAYFVYKNGDAYGLINEVEGLDRDVAYVVSHPILAGALGQFGGEKDKTYANLLTPKVSCLLIYHGPGRKNFLLISSGQTGKKNQVETENSSHYPRGWYYHFAITDLNTIALNGMNPDLEKYPKFFYNVAAVNSVGADKPDRYQFDYTCSITAKKAIQCNVVYQETDKSVRKKLALGGAFGVTEGCILTPDVAGNNWNKKTVKMSMFEALPRNSVVSKAMHHQYQLGGVFEEILVACTTVINYIQKIAEITAGVAAIAAIVAVAEEDVVGDFEVISK